MKVVVVTGSRLFQHCADGTVWTRSSHAYGFWARYLGAFDHVGVVTRSLQAEDIPAGSRPADGEGVSFSLVPYYVGPWQYLRQARQIRDETRRAVGKGDAIILRLPNNLASAILPALRGSNRPYGVEVIADPYDTYVRGSVTHPLRPFLRWWFPRRLRTQCAGACAVAYVTRAALQRRYPPSAQAFSIHYSDVYLPDEAFIVSPRLPRHGGGPFRLVTVGYMAQLTKGVDVLIKAVAQCQEEGLDLRLTVVGDGELRPALQRLAADLGLGERVHFCGQLPAGEAVREQLDQADLFVLASRAEGLPRAMLEAMARGLPCIGSAVGGMTELLDSEGLAPCGNVAALAGRIRALLSRSDRMLHLSAANLERARGYREEDMRERRYAFCRYVRDRTADWCRVNGIP